jgi:hypothetical protein
LFCLAFSINFNLARAFFLSSSVPYGQKPLRHTHSFPSPSSLLTQFPVGRWKDFM